MTVTGLPMSVGVPVPYSNCTVPGADGLTVAFNVTDVPPTCGLAGSAPSDVVVVVSVGAG